MIVTKRTFGLLSSVTEYISYLEAPPSWQTSPSDGQATDVNQQLAAAVDEAATIHADPGSRA